MSLEVREKASGKVYKVWKYLESSDKEISVWCHEWYGRHVVGQDCELVTHLDLLEEWLKDFPYELLREEDVFQQIKFLRENKG